MSCIVVGVGDVSFVPSGLEARLDFDFGFPAARAAHRRLLVASAPLPAPHSLLVSTLISARLRKSALRNNRGSMPFLAQYTIASSADLSRDLARAHATERIATRPSSPGTILDLFTILTHEAQGQHIDAHSATHTTRATRAESAPPCRGAPALPLETTTPAGKKRPTRTTAMSERKSDTHANDEEQHRKEQTTGSTRAGRSASITARPTPSPSRTPPNAEEDRIAQAATSHASISPSIDAADMKSERATRPTVSLAERAIPPTGEPNARAIDSAHSLLIAS
jgi:hypothetical protein